MIFKQLNKASCKTYLIGSENTKEVIVVDPVLEHVNEYVTFHIPDGFDCHLSDVPVKVMYTPGHTKDSMCLLFPDRILTGDTLFLDDGGSGRTDLPGGDHGENWESIQKIKIETICKN
jgi:hypothetical protein